MSSNRLAILLLLITEMLSWHRLYSRASVTQPLLLNKLMHIYSSGVVITANIRIHNL
jgi:hypothetical protein